MKTGGVTPVYAAPETFDGWVSRFSDQYSLAIVYQELLTGQRPFPGGNVRQLIMQHLQGTPDLSALPPEDRPIIEIALAKHPDERHPTCRAMIEAPDGDIAGISLDRIVGVDIPLKVHGSLSAPRVRPDVKRLLEAAARQQLEKEGEEVEKKLRQKLEDKLKDLLGQ